MLSNNELPSPEMNQFKTELRFVVPNSNSIKDLMMKKAFREINKESARKLEKNGTVTPISVKLLRIRPTYDLS